MRKYKYPYSNLFVLSISVWVHFLNPQFTDQPHNYLPDPENNDCYITQNQHHTVLEGNIYQFGDQTLEKSGLYVDTIPDIQNICDTIIELQLTVLPIQRKEFFKTLCTGSSYSFNGETLSQSGIYIDTLFFQDVAEIQTLYLNFSRQIVARVKKTICEGETCTYFGKSYDQTGTYYDTLSINQECDSILILELEVIPRFSDNIPINLCDESSYFFNGKEYIGPGIFSDTLINSLGCDSIITFDIKTFSSQRVSIDTQVCNTEQFIFNNSILRSSGTYRYTLSSVTNGCDSIVTLNIDFIKPDTIYLQSSICEGDAYNFNGRLLKEAGRYQQSFTNESGCDSLVVLDLNINPEIIAEVNLAICPNEPYYWNGIELDSAGFYHQTFRATNGCDSIVALKLSYFEVPDTFVSKTICQGDTLRFNGNVYHESGQYELFSISENGCSQKTFLELTVSAPQDTSITHWLCEGNFYLLGQDTLREPGDYSQLLKTSNGCDSMVHLKLILEPLIVSSMEMEICEGDEFMFGGQTLTQSGNYKDTLVLNTGCPRVIELELSVIPGDFKAIRKEICAGNTYQFGERIIAESGVYSQVSTNQLGCDSTITLHLKVIDHYSTYLDTTVCNGNSVTIGNKDYSTAGIFIDTLTSTFGCDSIVTLDLKTIVEKNTITIDTTICEGDVLEINGSTLEQAGQYLFQYTSSYGCDSTVVLNLDIFEKIPAEVGADLNVCTELADLNGNLPPMASGQWTTPSQAFINIPEQSTTHAFELEEGNHPFIWTLSGPSCPNYSSDTLYVNFNRDSPEASDDFFNFSDDQKTFSGVLLGNDKVNSIFEWDVELYKAPNIGEIELTKEGTFEYQTSFYHNFNTSFTYVLFNRSCPDLNDTAQVNLTLNFNELELANLLGVTPNGDGINDQFVIPELLHAGSQFPENELMVYNRWGNLVYQKKNYANDWQAIGKNGKVLPVGTYYYLLILNGEERIVKDGSLVIIH